MNIARVERLSADGGWRIFDFVKVTLEDGLVGWSEFSRALNGPGICEAIDAIGAGLIGQDPRSAIARVRLMVAGRASNIAYQACGALSNALLDLRARALNVAVIELLGGRVRERVPVYWAHCGTYRTSHAELMERPPLRTLDDVVALGREVSAAGFTALKTNLLLFEDGRARRYAPRRAEAAPSLTTSPHLERALQDEMEALHQGAGDNVAMMVDLGSNFRLDAAVTMTRAMERFRPTWVEVELRDARTLRELRNRTSVPVAGGERLRADEFYELLGARAVDIPIVDVLFNGLVQALPVAAAADAHDQNIAVHNCYSPLATLMGAAFCASVPNLQMLELDVDGVPWQNDFLTCPPLVRDGHLELPSGPGWGTEIDEAAVRAHPVSG
jgi:galactonate dehydratase